MRPCCAPLRRTGTPPPPEPRRHNRRWTRWRQSRRRSLKRAAHSNGKGMKDADRWNEFLRSFPSFFMRFFLDTPLARTPSRVNHSRRFLNDRTVANLFLLPTVLLLIAINVFPLFWSLYLSFCKYNDLAPEAAKWIGGANYTHLLANP